jgi:hypothetical protein
VSGRIFGPKREGDGSWGNFLHGLYSSLDILRDITSRRLRWAEARKSGGMFILQWLASLKGKDRWDDLGEKGI